jgi:hypothetical protein
MSIATKVKHPDAVFGADNNISTDKWSAFIEEMRAGDVTVLPPTQRVMAADGVALAAKRLVAEYDKLIKLKGEVDAKATATTAALADIEAREKAVSARETLAGLQDPIKCEARSLRRRVWHWLWRRAASKNTNERLYGGVGARHD